MKGYFWLKAGVKLMKKILWLSDSPTTTTGYATVTRNILNRLKNCECHCIGHNYVGQTLKPPIYFKDNSLINFHLHGTGRSKYAMDIISSTIRDGNFDIFGGLLDTFMLFEAGFMNIDTSPAKTFFYYPSDGGGGLPSGCDNILRKVNLPISMSKFGRDQVKKAHNIDSEYIPHGYDDTIFYPLKEKDKLKNREKWNLTNKYVVGVVARNQGRKALDRTLKAFKLFCIDKPEAVLLMHCDPNDMAQAFSLPNLIARFELQNRVLFTGTTFFKSHSYKEMNEIYNLMDVFLLTTTGEGFGIPTIEAMGCGIPQIVTDYTTSKELVEDVIQTGEVVKLVGETDNTPYPHTSEILEGTLTGNWDVERGLISIKDCCDKLNLLYHDRDLAYKYAKNSLLKAKTYYTWNNVMPMWDKVFERLTE